MGYILAITLSPKRYIIIGIKFFKNKSNKISTFVARNIEMIKFVSPFFNRLNIGENKFNTLWLDNDFKDKNDEKFLEKK